MTGLLKIKKIISFLLVFTLFSGLLPIGITAGAVDLSISEITLNETRTIITVNFNQNVTAVSGVSLLSKVKLSKNNVVPVTLSSGCSIELTANSMIITLNSALTAAQNYIRIENGTFEGQTAEIISATFNAEGPNLEDNGVSINNAKTVLTLQFSEAIAGYPTDSTLKNGYIKLARNGATFSETIPSDDITIDGSNGQIEITLDTPLSGSTAKLLIVAGKLKNKSTGNINLEDIITPAISASFDKMPPELNYTNTSLSSDNKTLTLYFTENIVNVFASGVSSSAAIEILKSHILLNRNGSGYAALGGADSVSLGSNYISIKFSEALTGGNNTIQIDGGSIRDTTGNIQYDDIESGRLIASTTPTTTTDNAPTYNSSTGSYISSDNSKVTFQFSTTVMKNSSLSESQMRARIYVKRNNGSYTSLNSRDTVTFSGSRVIIDLYNSFSGNYNRIKILSNTVSSTTGLLLSSDIESVYFNIDDDDETSSSDAPAYYNVTYDSSAKQVKIYFNRDLNEVSSRTDLSDFIRISRNGGSFTTLSNYDSVYIYPSNAITIDLNTALTGNNNRFKILGGALEDEYENIQYDDQTTASINGNSATTDNNVSFSLSSDGKVASIIFPNAIYSNYLYDTNYASLKQTIYVSRNAGSSYNVLGTYDSISISGNTVRIILQNALDDSDIIRIPKNSLKDAYGNVIDYEIKVGTDYSGTGIFDPNNDITLSNNGYTITFSFGERIYNNMSSINNLKTMIQVSYNGYTYNSLDSSDNVYLNSSDGELTINLSEPIEDTDARVKILAGALEDSDGNTINYDLISNELGQTEEDTSAYVDNTQVYFVNTTTSRDSNNNKEFKAVINGTSAISALGTKADGVTLSVKLPESAYSGTLSMSGDVLALLKEKNGTISLESGGAAHIIPVAAVDIDTALKALDVDVSKPQNAVVEININRISGQYENDLDDSADENSFSIILPTTKISMCFRISGETYNVDKFDKFVEKRFKLSSGQYANANTTVVRVEESGDINPVPSSVNYNDGSYYVSAKTRTSGVYAVISASHYFNDTPNWAVPAVNALASRLILSEYSGTYFYPKESATRAEVASVMTKALGIYTDMTGASKFFDVTLTDDYFNAVSAAAEYELIRGYSDSTFRPDKNITRQEMMAVIARAIRLATEKSVSKSSSMTKEQAEVVLAKFKDNAMIADWATIDTAECVKAGIIKGDDLGQINPNANITRAELAQIMYNILIKYGFIK